MRFSLIEEEGVKSGEVKRRKPKFVNKEYGIR